MIWLRRHSACKVAVVALLVTTLLASIRVRAEEATPPKRVLLVTHAGGFMHDSLLTAERVLKSLGQVHGLQVTCFRFTADPDARIKVKRKQSDQEIELETTALEDYSFRFQKAMGEPVTRQECGLINAESLKKFDAVMFFTTSTWTKERGSHPLTESELNDLIAWVKSGGGFVATHCGSDTLHNTAYGELVGATFGGHPWVQKVRLRAEDPQHPAAKGLADGSEIFDEIYQFGGIPNHPAAVPLKVQPFSRDKLHIILSVDNRSIDVTKGSRDDQDYPVAWCQRFGRGRSFYTSLGHHKEVWTDPRFHQHLMGGLKWALGQADGDATPSAKLKSSAKDDQVLFDFEEPTDLDGWANLELPKSETNEPAAKIERVAENSTSGEHCLKITFRGGTWPTVITSHVPDNWMAWETFKADVAVVRPCLVGFCVMQEGSSRAAGWDGGVSRWAKTEFLKPGKNTISAGLHPNDWSAIRTKLENGKALGRVVSLEVFLYRPHDGEAIFVDNIRVSATKMPPPQPATTQFQVLGTDLVVSGVQELGKKLADQWTAPEPQTVEQVEARFRSLYEDLKKEHPRAVLAVLRDGEKGYAPSNPDEIYSGWRDAYWSSHGPDGLTVDRSTNFGQSETQEIFMRHRSPLMRVDLSSIPLGSNILAARLLIVRAAELEKERSPLKPNMWVAEACNRPWTERDVDAYRYSVDKYWKAIGGMFWQNDDPDFWPIYLAHGPSQPGCSHWDFTHAVRFWTDGQHANHGFMLHGDSKDWFRAWYREAPKLKDRPAVIVIYEPK